MSNSICYHSTCWSCLGLFCKRWSCPRRDYHFVSLLLMHNVPMSSFKFSECCWRRKVRDCTNEINYHLKYYLRHIYCILSFLPQLAHSQLQMYLAMSFLPQFLRAWTNSLIVGSFAKVLKYSSRHSVGLLPSACIKFNLSEWTFSSLPTLRHVLRVQVSPASSCVWTYMNKVPFTSPNISIWETWTSTWQKEKEGNKYLKLFGTCSLHNFEVCAFHINKFPDLGTFVLNH